MTNPAPTLDSASFFLPDGRCLFSDVSLSLDQRRTGLVGRNGVGKSVLAQILAGRVAPTSGRCLPGGPVFYLPQQIVAPAGASVARLAGAQAVLDALARIEAGSVEVGDFETVADRWDMPQRLTALLDRHGLGHLHADAPADALSGGEQTRVALLGAWLSEADFLVLDEPTNHLDRTQRRLLREQLQDWNGGLLVVSHDRELLQTMQRIVELTAAGVRDYPGDYAFYAHASAQRHEQAVQELDRRKLERRRGEAELRAQRERIERRVSRGAREARDANQAPILLGLRRQRSEASAGKLKQRQVLRSAALDQRVAEAAQQVEDETAVALFAPLPPAAAQRRAALLDGVVLPHGVAANRPLDLIVTGCQRIGLTGANGSGKSTLLRVLAGQLAPLRGVCTVPVSCACLDQTFASLDPQRSVLEQLRRENPASDEAVLRTRLALLGLESDAVNRRCADLSGGERLKAALACALYRDRPAGLLLLDEPTNHLDLASTQALERMLRQYRGALVVVSHDHAFLDQLALDTRLEPGRDGWLREPW